MKTPDHPADKVSLLCDMLLTLPHTTQCMLIDAFIGAAEVACVNAHKGEQWRVKGSEHHAAHAVAHLGRAMFTLNAKDESDGLLELDHALCRAAMMRHTQQPSTPGRPPSY